MFHSPLQLSIDSYIVLNLLLNSDQNEKKRKGYKIYIFLLEQGNEEKNSTSQIKGDNIIEFYVLYFYNVFLDPSSYVTLMPLFLLHNTTEKY